MRNLVSIRTDSDNDLDLDSIDDTRNGLLLHTSVHNLLGPGRVAFLRVSLTPFHHLPPPTLTESLADAEFRLECQRCSI